MAAVAVPGGAAVVGVWWRLGPKVDWDGLELDRTTHIFHSAGGLVVFIVPLLLAFVVHVSLPLLSLDARLILFLLLLLLRIFFLIIFLLLTEEEKRQFSSSSSTAISK